MEIIFNEISAAEMADLPKLLQLELLAEFQSLPEDPAEIDKKNFGIIERDGKRLYRHRAKDYRLYFEISDKGLTIHRVLSKNTIRDFLFRTELPMPNDEDEEIGKKGEFWEMIEEGENSKSK